MCGNERLQKWHKICRVLLTTQKTPTTIQDYAGEFSIFHTIPTYFGFKIIKSVENLKDYIVTKQVIYPRYENENHIPDIPLIFLF